MRLFLKCTHLVHPCTSHQVGTPLENSGTPWGARYTRLTSTALDRLPGIAGAQVMAERLQILQEIHRELVGILLINFCLFCLNFWTRSARKSIKRSKDSYCSLGSKKNFEPQNLMNCSTPRGWRHHPNQICINILSLCKHQWKTRDLKPKFFLQS